MKDHHIVYVPGLGDPRYGTQGWILKLWRLLGVRAHYCPMRWGDKEPFAPKFEKLLGIIDELIAQNHEVSLIGISAGASAVLNAFAARKDRINGVVCVCGKINHPETVRPERYKANPAFKDSLEQLQKSLGRLGPAERSRIMSIHPIDDATVPPADTIIEGAIEKTVASKGHVTTIATQITFGAAGIVRFLASQANQPKH